MSVSQRARVLRAQQSRKKEVYVVLALIMVGGVLCGVWGNRLEAQRVTLKSLHHQKLEELAQIQTEIRTVRQSTDRKKELGKTIRAYQDLKSNPLVPTLVLDIVSKELTPFALWLTHLRMDNREILVEGEGLKKTDVPRFIKQMQEHQEFRHIRLVEIQGGLSEKSPQFHFTVTMQIVTEQVYDKTI